MNDNNIEAGDAPVMSAPVDRRQLLRWGAGTLGFVAAGGLLAACSTESADPVAPQPTTPTTPEPDARPNLPGALLTIRSTDVSWLWAPYLVADGLGYFEEEGLTQRGQALNIGEVAGVVLSGSADMIIGSPVGPFKTALAGRPLIPFASCVTTYASNIVITGEKFEAAGLTDSSSAAERAAALRGLTIATTGVGAGPDLLVRYVASELGGLDPATDLSLTPVQGGGNAMLAAVDAGQIDGFCLSSPTSDSGVQQFGMRYLFNMSEDPIEELVGYLYIVMSTTPEYLAEKPEYAVAYARGLQRALNYIKEEPEGFKDFMRGLFGNVDPAVFEAGFESNKSIYGDTIVISKEQFEQNRSFLVRELELNNEDPAAALALTFEESINTSIAEQAVASLA
jgi:ABC-type nitrate/sulfonate/bicarbonate transport system substrate-binding protein